MKTLYFDVETTGFDPVKNDIVQLAGIIDIDGEIVDMFNIRSRPEHIDNISPKALEVTGLKLEDIMQYQTATEAYMELKDKLDKHIDKYDRLDKFYPAGYNVHFDLDFVAKYFDRHGDGYGFGSYVNWKAIDPLPILRFLEFSNIIKLTNYKLGTVCEKMGIDINAHDAYSDIKATRKLIIRLKQYMQKLK